MPFLGTRGAGTNKAFGFAGPGKPNQVTGLTATDFGTSRAFNNGRIDLSWSTPANNGATISGYKIERSTNGSSYSTLVANTGTTATTYSDTSLTSAQIYYYRVSAINTVGTGDASTAANATATTIPAVPTIGTVTRTNNTTVSVPFTGATGGSNLTSGTVTSSPSISLSTSGTSSPFTVTGSFVQGQAYSFTLTTTNANGTSGSSGSSNSVTPFAATAPSAPTIGTVSVTNSTTVSVPYTDGSANGSAITSRTITSSPSISLSYSNTSSSPVTVTGSFVAGTAYTFSMTATNGVGTSSSSSASNSVTPSPIPKAAYFAGGINQTPSFEFTIYKLLYSNETLSTLSASAGYAHQIPGSASNGSVAGYVFGGNTLSGGTQQNAMYKINFASDTVSGLSAPFSQPLAGVGANTNVGSAAYPGGGEGAQGTTYRDIYKISYSTDGSSKIAATFNSDSRGSCGLSNGNSAGYWVGGTAPGYYGPSSVNIVRKIAYSTETSSNLGAVWVTSNVGSTVSGEMTNGTTAGYTYSGSGQSGIGKFTFSTETSASAGNFADGWGGNGCASRDGVGGYASSTQATSIYKLTFSGDTKSVLSAVLPARRTGMGTVYNK